MSIEKKDLLAHFHSEWRFTRGLTLDLLRSLTEAELAFTPGAALGPLWKQFRHLGRVQENYLEALHTGRINFSTQNARGKDSRSGDSLLAYLELLDRELMQALDSLDASQKIDWFGSPVGADEHLMRLASHETLHLGQIVAYIKLLGRPFPPSWSAWGLK